MKTKKKLLAVLLATFLLCGVLGIDAGAGSVQGQLKTDERLDQLTVKTGSIDPRPNIPTDDYGNDFDNAHLLNFHTSPLFASVSGVINWIGDIDVFYFRAPVAGTYHIYALSNMDTYGKLYQRTLAFKRITDLEPESSPPPVQEAPQRGPILDSAAGKASLDLSALTEAKLGRAFYIDELIAENNDAGSGNKNFSISWTLAAGQTYFIAVNGSGNATGNYTLRVEYASYIVYFDSNGGDGTMEPAIFTRGEPNPLPECTFTNQGKEFKGWCDNYFSPVHFPMLKDGQDINEIPPGIDKKYFHAIWDDYGDTFGTAYNLGILPETGRTLSGCIDYGDLYAQGNAITGYDTIVFDISFPNIDPSGDVDVFKFVAPVTGEYKIDVSSCQTGSGWGYELILFSGNENYIGSVFYNYVEVGFAPSRASNQTICAELIQGETYYLKMVSLYKESQLDYSITIEPPTVSSSAPAARELAAAATTALRAR